VGDAHNVGAGGCHCRQDLETAWPLWLLAKREQGCVKMMFGYVLRGCANAQDWEKRKEKMEKKKKKRKEKKETHTHCKPIYQLHGTGSSMPAISCGSKGIVGCMPTTGCA